MPCSTSITPELSSSFATTTLPTPETGTTLTCVTAPASAGKASSDSTGRMAVRIMRSAMSRRYEHLLATATGESLIFDCLGPCQFGKRAWHSRGRGLWSRGMDETNERRDVVVVG